MNKELDEETLQDLYAWIDKVPLSRPKRNITRDFSDGVMAAEVVKYFFPKLVELHNYTPANSTHQKLSNWGTLNRQGPRRCVFHRQASVKPYITLLSKGVCEVEFQCPRRRHKENHVMHGGYIEPILCTLREKIDDKRLGRNFEERIIKDLEYYSTINDKSQTEHLRVPAMPTHVKPGPGQKKEDRSYLQKARPMPSEVPGAHVDPTFRLLMEEKEQALLALQETVEILQIKVNRLEHLVQLKDLRIEDLTRHLERFKSRANVP